MTSFSELSTQVHRIKDMILTDMVYDIDVAEDSLKFSKHLHSAKFWFARISSANKKKFLLCLLNEIKSGWSLSWILKSIWNCYTKDAVLSSCEQKPLSSYDISPMDHNRTAQPAATLAHAMSIDRTWFHSLQPEAQAVVLTELLTISGGPIMWAVYKRAHLLYDRYRDRQMQTIVDSMEQETSTDSPKKTSQQLSPKKDKASKLKMKRDHEPEAPYLQPWNAAIKAIQDRLKLEEVDVMFKDGTTKKIWKINRVKPEIIEAVDFLQLLPSSIGKMILAYLPRDQLNQYAQVNKYWAFLVEELKAELAARVKIDLILAKLQGLMFRHDSTGGQSGHPEIAEFLHMQQTSLSTSLSAKKNVASIRASMKSAKSGKSVFSMPPITDEALKLRQGQLYQPVSTMAELNERLERRGAADENIFQWCENIANQARRARRRAAKANEDHKAQKKYKVSIPTMVEEEEDLTEGILPSTGMFFPCPLLKKRFNIPMEPPLTKDPTYGTTAPLKRNISNLYTSFSQDIQSNKHIGLWSKDFSRLYQAFKIPSHQYPI